MERKETKKILEHFYKKYDKKLEEHDIDEIQMFFDKAYPNESNDRLLSVFRFCYINMKYFSGQTEELIDFFMLRMDSLRGKLKYAEKQLRIVVKSLIEHKKGKDIPVFEDVITKKLLREAFDFKELASYYREIEEFKKDFLRTFKSYKLVEPLISLENEKILKQQIIVW